MPNKDNVATLRREFDAAPLVMEMLPDDPHQLFEIWFSQVLEAKIDDPNACVLATVDIEGRPDTRVVLLKDFSIDAFIFYTNYSSRKALQIQTNAWVALNFYWPSLFRQVRIRGQVTKVSSETSADYFHKRPRQSQIAVYASQQSSVTTREELEAKFDYYQQHFSNHTTIPYPASWGGYSVNPVEFEFWHGRPHRLHDRVEYLRSNDGWVKQTLAP